MPILLRERGHFMIVIDYKDRRPIYEQVVEKFKELILSGGLEADTQLPSVRNLAMDLSINPNTIQRAYAELERTGFIYSVKGKGSFIAPNDDLQRYKRTQVFDQAKHLVHQAILMGISYDTFVAHIQKCYEEDSQ